ncbi:MAG: DAK2 domain-containing protein [Actinomycetota bacterium]|jgi:DAK2 domain fusion protein YloV|nr:DAK2 domain-containing protein [Actinomycetota bacterium]
MLDEINEQDLKRAIDIIIENFKENEAKINELNVFPVPDGDTGTNMLLTLKAVREQISKLDDFSVKNVLEEASFAALMGARGNSGVILSQILKGLFDVIIESDDFNLDVIKEALKSARDLAYSSVQNPTEGTMLTTIKDICDFVESLTNNTHKIKMTDFLDEIISETEKSVERSTLLLPVLKKADVVDAGAQGILDILIGTKKALKEIESINGRELEKKVKETSKVYATSAMDTGNDDKQTGSHAFTDGSGIDEQTEKESLEEVKRTYEIKYVYCTELMLKGKKIDVDRLRERIESYGDSAMVVGNENMVKIHVHTNQPHKVLRAALREGTIHNIQINNMEDQRREAVGVVYESESEEKSSVLPRALVAVANGEGLEEIFKSIGVDVIVNGGQSMNPSTYDIVKEINNLESSDVFIFPNNKNIILAANQAKQIIRNKNIYIIPTTSIPEGISAVLSYNPDAGIEENIKNMEEAAKKTKSGEVTQAVRDANLMVSEIKKGEFIGLSDGRVRVVSNNVVDAVADLVRDIATSTEEVVTIYTGKDAKQEDTDNIRKKIKEYFPKIDIEIHKGEQPLYPYIFSIE